MIDPFTVVLGFNRYQFAQFLKLHPLMQENKPEENLFSGFLPANIESVQNSPRNRPVDHARKLARGYSPAGHF